MIFDLNYPITLAVDSWTRKPSKLGKSVFNRDPGTLRPKPTGPIYSEIFWSQTLINVFSIQDECEQYVKNSYPKWDNLNVKVLDNGRTYTNQQPNLIDSLLMVNNQKQIDLGHYGVSKETGNLRDEGISHQNIMHVYNQLYQRNISDQLNLNVAYHGQEQLSPRAATEHLFRNQNENQQSTVNSSNLKSPRTFNTSLGTKQPYNVIQNIVLNPVLPTNTLTQSFEFNKSRTEIELLRLSNNVLNSTDPLNGSGTLQPIIDLIKVGHDPITNDNLVKEYQKILERQDSHTFMQQNLKSSLKSEIFMPGENLDLIQEKLASPRNIISAIPVTSKEDSTESGDYYHPKRK
jgi:hypothetical protein